MDTQNSSSKNAKKFTSEINVAARTDEDSKTSEQRRTLLICNNGVCSVNWKPVKK